MMMNALQCEKSRSGHCDALKPSTKKVQSERIFSEGDKITWNGYRIMYFVSVDELELTK